MLNVNHPPDLLLLFLAALWLVTLGVAFWSQRWHWTLAIFFFPPAVVGYWAARAGDRFWTSRRCL